MVSGTDCAGFEYRSKELSTSEHVAFRDITKCIVVTACCHLTMVHLSFISNIR